MSDGRLMSLCPRSLTLLLAPDTISLVGGNKGVREGGSEGENEGGREGIREGGKKCGREGV